MSSSVLPPAPSAKSPLARYRLLSPTASVRVSPLCLGGMSLGSAWESWMGSSDKKTVDNILDAFYELGGNFIDTSNNYQQEESETWIGDWMESRNVRDQMVIATKYTTNYHAGRGDSEILANYQGNGTKSLHVSVNASLKKLKTDYIDLLYVHWWDFSVSIPELMQSLNNLVITGKVLYLGISDTPAWVVSKANEYARNHGMRQFSVYQGRWSAAQRDFEREILPMCHAENMGIAPWGSLGGGAFKTKGDQGSTGKGRNIQPTEKDMRVAKVLEDIAKRKGTELTSIALAYVMHKVPYVFPIVGCRTVDHIRKNVEALKISLSDEEINEIEDAEPFDAGFPNNFLYGPGSGHAQEVRLLSLGGTMEHVPYPKAIGRG